MIKSAEIQSYNMLATGSGYAFNCDFSDSLFSVLMRKPGKRDTRIDRMCKGITAKRIFEAARKPFVSDTSEFKQVPVEHDGGLANEVLVPVSSEIVSDYNDANSLRTIYGRIFFYFK